MRKIITTLGALLALAIGSNSWGQSVFLKYGPVAGIQKSTGATYQNTAAASADVIGLWGATPSPCTASSFLRGDGNCAVPAGTGVTSVAQTVPAGFTVTGSPVTSTGTLAISYATGQTANLFLATPNGSTGAISERAIVGADVPPTALGTTTNGGVSGILLGTNGGTSNGFFSITGPATSLKTFTFPNASATVLTSNAAVTVAQGGTGLATLTANGVLLGEGTSNVNPLVMGADTVLRGTAAADPVAAAVPNCGSSTTALSYNTTTHAFGCQTIAGSGGTPAGSTTQLQYNNAGAFAGAAGLLYSTGVPSTFGSSTTAIGIATGSAVPQLTFINSAAAANQKIWDTFADSSGILHFRAVNDAYSVGNDWLTVARSAGTATDITFAPLNNLFITAGGAAPSSAASALAMRAGGNNPTINFVNSAAGATDAKIWAQTLSGVSLKFQTVNDAYNATHDVINMTRATGAFSTGGVGVFIGDSVTHAADTLTLYANLIYMPNITQTSSPQTGTICWQTSGGGSLSIDTTVACLSSTRRVKQAIEPLDTGLSAVMRMHPVSYDLKPEFNPAHLGRQVGLVAEEVQAIDPRLVALDDEGQPRGVRYMQMTAVLVKAIQQQQREIYALWAALALSLAFTFYRTRRHG